MKHCPARKKNSSQSWRAFSEQKEGRFLKDDRARGLIHSSFAKRQICPIPALLKHPQIITDPPPNFMVGVRPLRLKASPGLHRGIRQPCVENKMTSGLIREDHLHPVLYGPILVVSCHLSRALLCFSLIAGFFMFVFLSLKTFLFS